MAIARKTLGIVGSLVLLAGVGIYLGRDSAIVYQLLSQWNCQNSSLAVCNPPRENAEQLTATGKNGAVVSTQKKASEIGLQILQNGGNAIDAAVGMGYGLAVSDPCCGNLGGGGFMLIRLADGTETFIDFRETAPGDATKDMYLDEAGNVVEGLSTRGYLAVGVPGTVKGLEYALTKYGTMQSDRLLQPAIALAQNGYILQEGDVDIFEAGKDRLAEPNVTAIFLREDKVYRPGERLIQRDLANSLRLIAQQGSKAFYHGEIAQKIVTASQANNGILSLEDFANYQVEESAPVRCDYRGYQVISAPPPGGGTTVCQILNILSGYDLKALGNKTPESLHRFFSAMLLGFSDRNRYLGDPNFVDNPVDQLLSAEYADKLRNQIGDRAINPESVYSNIQSEGTNTTHYSVVDKEGNAVAVTYTINSYFGAGVMAPGTGFLLNNEMDDFTSKLGEANQFGLRQGETNLIEPGKRPLSSMSPTIVTKDGKLFLVTGSPGGSTIPTTVVQVITNAIDYGLNLNDAVNSPRLHYQGFPDRIISEPKALKSTTIKGLQAKGYKILPFSTWGAAESILVNPETGFREGVNDVRKPAGKALAY